MVHLIVGYGEVGQAIGKVIGKHLWYSRTGGTWKGQPVDVVHICVPYVSEDQFGKVIFAMKHVSPLIIVHSSVPVGTCDFWQVAHSPIRGIHPHLEKGIRTFVKYFGGKNARKAAKIFSNLGIKTKVYQQAKTTEAIKLWDTTQYGKLIMMEKEIYKWCKENGISFDEVYRNANKDYDEGYTKLGMPHVVRPYLKHVEGQIGGHCVLPNAKLLGIKL